MFGNVLCTVPGRRKRQILKRRKCRPIQVSERPKTGDKGISYPCKKCGENLVQETTYSTFRRTFVLMREKEENTKGRTEGNVRLRVFVT